MQNPDIARLFDEVADLLEIQGANPFRVRAYRNAARIVRDYPEPLAEVVRSGTHDLTEIAGIGDDLAEKITAIVTTGELPLRRELAAQLPPGLLDLLRIPGLGPKRVKELHDKLHVTSAADLAEAEVTCSLSCSSLTRLGPRPGMRSRSSRPGGSWAASSLRSGSSPVVTIAVIFSARSSPMPAISVRSCVPERTTSARGSG